MLTVQEQAVLTCLEAGLRNKEIMEALGMTRGQVAGAVYRLRGKGFPKKPEKERPNKAGCQFIEGDLPKLLRRRWRTIDNLKCLKPVYKRSCCFEHFKKGYPG